LDYLVCLFILLGNQSNIGATLASNKLWGNQAACFDTLEAIRMKSAIVQVVLLPTVLLMESSDVRIHGKLLE